MRFVGIYKPFRLTTWKQFMKTFHNFLAVGRGLLGKWFRVASALHSVFYWLYSPRNLYISRRERAGWSLSSCSPVATKHPSCLQDQSVPSMVWGKPKINTDDICISRSLRAGEEARTFHSCSSCFQRTLSTSDNW